MDSGAKTTAVDFESATGLTSAASANHAATQVERVAHLVAQEVVMVRQSGANALAVSLKLDPHTELFLQLTNHNGQMQASLRCERGSIAGLEGHWTDLQDSLARQNVQLLPLEVKSTASAFNNTSSQNPRQQDRELPQDAPAVMPAKNNSTAKSKTKNNSKQGWESWA